MDRRGFTLVEALVSVVVLSIALLAVLKMAIIYVQSNTYSNLYNEAVVAAQDKMEQLRHFAVSDRNDRMGVIDFDYLTSQRAAFTSVSDGGVKIIPGYLSEEAAPATTKVAYDQMTYVSDDPPHWEGSDTVRIHTASTASQAYTVSRKWKIYLHQDTQKAAYGAEQYPYGDDENPYYEYRADFALLEVTAEWTDMQGPHDLTIKSLIHRRQ